MPSQFDDCICGICARREVGLGYMDKSNRRNKPILWLCDDPECAKIAQEVYGMKQDDFTRIESLAAQKGGDAATDFLDQIGKTDLVTLTVDEFCELWRRVVAGYRKALMNDLRDEAPF